MSLKAMDHKLTLEESKKIVAKGTKLRKEFEAKIKKMRKLYPADLMVCAK